MPKLYRVPLWIAVLTAFGCETGATDDPVADTDMGSTANASDVDGTTTAPSADSSGDPTGDSTAGPMTDTDDPTTTGGNPNAGMLDPDFGADGWVFVDVDEFDEFGFGLAVREDDTLIVGGEATTDAGSGDFLVVQLLPDGQLDPAFDDDGIATLDYASAGFQAGRGVELDGQGRIVVPGQHFDLLAAARVLADGTPDGDFDDDGMATTVDDFASQMTFNGAVGPNDEVAVVGQYDFSLGVALFDSDGAAIDTFDGDGLVATDFPGYDEVVGQEVLFTAGGQLLVAGFALDTAGTSNFILRYQPDGQLDPTFGEEGGYTLGTYGILHEAQSLAELPDGSILIAGLALVGMEEGYVVARHAPDGTLDLSFGTDGYVDSLGMSRAHDIAVDDDGSFYLAGDLEGLGESTDISVAKHMPDGTPDPSFGNGGFAVFDSGSDTETVYAIEFHGDDGLAIAGHVRNDGFSDVAVLRLFK
ncbi:MAG: hypothetical protein AAF799_31730 [Myxococcota bacterium]